ncbi:MAG TPA: alpha/beta hydrolase [Vicinamibacteria bacterium]
MAAEGGLLTSDPEPLVFARPAGGLAYVDEGPRDAPVLFTLHGIPGSVRDFRYLAPLLTDQVRLVRVDLPGFGGSAPDETATRSLRGRGQAILDLADHLGVERFGLVGHSMGGGPALLLGARARARVSHLVLLASVGLTRHRGLGPSPLAFRAFGRALDLPGVGWLLAPLARRAYRRRRFPGADRMTARDLSVQIRAIGALDFDELGQAVAAGLPPTLVAFCRDDHMLEEAIPEALVRCIPGAQNLAFRDGGHNLQKTRAPEIASAILDFLGGAPLHGPP